MPMPKFTIDQTTKFINLYKDHPCLWQSDTKAYRDKVLRKRAIDEIVAAMNLPDFKFVDCQIKIKNIRSHYLQELKKIYNYNIRGVRRGERYTPTLVWFNLVDSFLWNYIVHQSPILLSLKEKRGFRQAFHANLEDTGVSELKIKKEEIDIEDDVISVNSWNMDEPDTGDNNEDLSAACNAMIYEDSEGFNHTTNNLRGKIHCESGYESIISESKILHDHENEFDIFGKGVAAQLKGLPMIEAVQLQLKIQQLITEHRLKIFMDQNSPTQTAAEREQSVADE